MGTHMIYFKTTGSKNQGVPNALYLDQVMLSYAKMSEGRPAGVNGSC
jgi:hypothetical protein